jgi:acetylornithine deacetylase/succinyl-diaminopimelate desuccinylase-like protein
MHTDDQRAAVAGLMPRLRAELETLVRLPSIAFPGFPAEPVRETAEAVADLLRAAGLLEVRLLDIEGAPPAVFAARPAQPGAPTALLYAHYDVQPAGDESLWTSPPFEPTERAGRLYGRGAADDKSGIVMHIGALNALGPDCPVGIKVLIEGYEEVSGRGIEAFVTANPDVLAADVIVIADVGNYGIGVPTLTTSLRGMAALDVEVETLEGAVHSGTFGGPAPDALIALARMIASLHTREGDVAVEGLKSIPHAGSAYHPDAFREDAGLLPGVDLIGTGSIAEHLSARPSINVIGLDAPPTDGARNALVHRAKARVSVRLAPGEAPAEAQAVVAEHLRKVAPWNARVTITPGTLGEGFLARTDGPAYASAVRALEAAFGTAVVHYGAGGSIPLVAAFHEALPDAEVILWGPEEPQCKIHGPDESVDLAELERCTLAEVLFLDGMRTGT